jgi:hypothetical protein
VPSRPGRIVSAQPLPQEVHARVWTARAPHLHGARITEPRERGKRLAISLVWDMQCAALLWVPACLSPCNGFNQRQKRLQKQRRTTTSNAVCCEQRVSLKAYSLALSGAAAILSSRAAAANVGTTSVMAATVSTASRADSEARTWDTTAGSRVAPQVDRIPAAPCVGVVWTLCGWCVDVVWWCVDVVWWCVDVVMQLTVDRKCVHHQDKVRSYHPLLPPPRAHHARHLVRLW